MPGTAEIVAAHEFDEAVECPALFELNFLASSDTTLPLSTLAEHAQELHLHAELPASILALQASTSIYAMLGGPGSG